MNPETLVRAYEIHCHQRLAGHEAAHAAVALILGLEVSKVTAPYWRLEDVEDCDDTDPAGTTWIERRSDPDGLRKLAIATIAGKLEDGRGYWPPRWPLPLAPEHGDEADLCQLVEELNLDAKSYSQLVADAYELVTSRPYARLHAAISHWLETYGSADQHVLLKLKAIAEGKTVEHTTKAATATVTSDEGEFTAIAATYSVDRQNDQIVRGAFAATIERWRASGKNLPVHWNHASDATNVIGYVDPATMRETTEGLQVSGKLDLADSDTAREAWRSMRNNAMSLSFGFLTLKNNKRSDGVNELQEIDLFEVSIVPVPANADTRVLSMKSIDDDGLDRVRTETRDLMLKVMGATPAETLREKSMRIAAEHAPIQVAIYEC